MASRPRRQADSRRRGSTYVVILGVSMVLTIIGLSAVTVARINTRAIAQDRDWADAQLLAFSGVEHALSTIGATSDWRTKFRTATTELPFGRGLFRWRLVDKADGDLADSSQDPFTVVATGVVGQGGYTLELACAVAGKPLSALASSLHAGGKITIAPNCHLTAVDGKASTNGELDLGNKSSVLTGDADAASVSGKGTVEGTLTVPAPAQQLPDPGVFDLYRDMATKIPANKSFHDEVLTPTNNPWGKPNSQGIYYIDAGKTSVTLTNMWIEGTLVVRCKKLTIGEGVVLQSASQDLPALIVDGDLNAVFASSDIQGLVHVKGDLVMGGTARIEGAVLCEGKASCGGQNTIVHASALTDRAPLGYTQGDGAIVVQGYKRVVD